MPILSIVPEFGSGLICCACQGKVPDGADVGLLACADGVFVLHSTCLPPNPPVYVHVSR